MPRIRPSVKRMHIERWKDWQKEAYMGVHTKFDFTPIPDAKGYQYRPIQVHASIRPYSAFDKPAPQVECWIPKQESPKESTFSRFLNWLHQ